MQACPKVTFMEAGLTHPKSLRLSGSGEDRLRGVLDRGSHSALRLPGSFRIVGLPDDLASQSDGRLKLHLQKFSPDASNRAGWRDVSAANTACTMLLTREV